jgi:uncharacterized protein YifE (UPF0438 family)
MPENIDQLRETYLQQAPYQYDPTVRPHFTGQEIEAIEKYGNWFEAIWEDRVPLATDKIKHFYLAKNRLFSERTKMEEIWFRYTSLRIPF